MISKRARRDVYCGCCDVWHIPNLNQTRVTVPSRSTVQEMAKVQGDEHGQYVRLSPGDDPHKVRQRTGIAYNVIQQLNPNVDFRNLPVGQKVYISGPYGRIETDSRGQFMRITAGDDLWKISQRTGVRHDVIQTLNPNVEFNNLDEGFKVYISC
jgi:LysM repeat protein